MIEKAHLRLLMSLSISGPDISTCAAQNTWLAIEDLLLICQVIRAHRQTPSVKSRASTQNVALAHSVDTTLFKRSFMCRVSGVGRKKYNMTE